MKLRKINAEKSDFEYVPKIPLLDSYKEYQKHKFGATFSEFVKTKKKIYQYLPSS